MFKIYLDTFLRKRKVSTGVFVGTGSCPALFKSKTAALNMAKSLKKSYGDFDVIPRIEYTERYRISNKTAVYG